MARYRPTPTEIAQSDQLLARAKAVGLRDREIAAIIGLTRPAVTQYGKPGKRGYIACMPEVHQAKLRPAVEQRERQQLGVILPNAGGDGYRQAHHLDTLTRALFNETNAEGPHWKMIVAFVEELLSQVRAEKRQLREAANDDQGASHRATEQDRGE